MRLWVATYGGIVVVLAVGLLLFAMLPSNDPAPRTSPTHVATAPSAAAVEAPAVPAYKCPLYRCEWADGPGTPSVVSFVVRSGDIDNDSPRETSGFMLPVNAPRDVYGLLRTGDDYLLSGYDRSHVRTDSLSDGSPHHEYARYWCNCVPMTPELNRGLYREFELLVQATAEQADAHVTVKPLYSEEMPPCGEWPVPSHYRATLSHGFDGEPYVREFVLPQNADGVELAECEVAP